MTGLTAPVLCAALAGVTFVAPALAHERVTSEQKAPRTNACTILTRDEVKKIVPWNAAVDRQKETEEPWGTGSVCFYPGVRIFVGEYSASRVEGARKIGPLVPIRDLGDEAFLQENGSSFVELYVKMGDRMVHIQKGIPFTETAASLKPAVIALGKAVIAKLH